MGLADKMFDQMIGSDRTEQVAAQVLWAQGVGMTHAKLTNTSTEADVKHSEAVANLIAAGFAEDSPQVKKLEERHNARQQSSDKMAGRVAGLKEPGIGGMFS